LLIIQKQSLSYGGFVLIYRRGGIGEGVVCLKECIEKYKKGGLGGYFPHSVCCYKCIDNLGRNFVFVLMIGYNSHS